MSVAEVAIALADALERLVAEGKIRAYGWSTDSPENAALFAEGRHCAAIQHHLNVLERNGAMVRFCEDARLASVNRGPLAMGLLMGKYEVASRLPKDDVRGAGHEWMWLFPGGRPRVDYLRRLEAIREILTSGDRTLSQGAIAWIWGYSEATIPIPGFKSVAQAEANAGALAFGPLTPAQMAEIDSLLTEPEA